MPTYSYITLEQPIGMFLLTVIPANELLQHYSVTPRAYEGDSASGTQRNLNKDRVKEIAAYTDTQDASFPTSIVLALNEGQYTIDEEQKQVTISGNVEIIDGQHRIEGLLKASKEIDASIPSRFMLPCVLIVEPTDEQKAFIFATINGKQTKG
jgi:DGQHR domain-containing protein